MSITREQLDDWTKKYGPQGEGFFVATVKGRELAFRTPDQPDWEEVQDAINSGKPSATKLRQMVLNSTIHPTRDEMDSLVTRYPAIPNALSAELGKLAGNDVEVTVKKG